MKLFLPLAVLSLVWLSFPAPTVSAGNIQFLSFYGVFEDSGSNPGSCPLDDFVSVYITRIGLNDFEVEMYGDYTGWRMYAYITNGVSTGTWYGLYGLDCSSVAIPVLATITDFSCAAGWYDSFASVSFRTIDGRHAIAASGNAYGCYAYSQMDPPGSTILPVTLANAGQPVVGCYGLVQLTFTNGASFPLYGHRLASNGCASAPCDPWSGLPSLQSCVPNPLDCCYTLYGVSAGTQDYVCLRSTFVRVDADTNGFWDVVLPAATITSPPC